MFITKDGITSHLKKLICLSCSPAVMVSVYLLQKFIFTDNKVLAHIIILVQSQSQLWENIKREKQNVESGAPDFYYISFAFPQKSSQKIGMLVLNSCNFKMSNMNPCVQQSF